MHLYRFEIVLDTQVSHCDGGNDAEDGIGESVLAVKGPPPQGITKAMRNGVIIHVGLLYTGAEKRHVTSQQIHFQIILTCSCERLRELRLLIMNNK